MGSDVYKIEYDDEPYGENLATIQKRINSASCIIGFNLKFDLHWLRRYGITFENTRVWDVQLAYFIINAQLKSYPSLDEVAEEYGLGKKIDIVAKEYWDMGIDTPEVPLDILSDYLKQDLNLTYQAYQHQLEYLEDKPKLKKLITLSSFDLLVLEEMEFNGIKLDVEACSEASAKCESIIESIDSELASLIAFNGINWGSPQQVSNVLYGGVHKYIIKEPVKSILKSGKESWRIRNVEYQHSFPRLVTPLKNTILATQQHWSTNEETLNELKANGKAKRIIELLLKRHGIAKMNNTYYKGVPKMIKELEWEDNFIHGNLNQCVAVTGRLSSTKPNMQNMPSDFDLMFRSRYVD